MISDFGSFVGKKSERVVVKTNGQLVAEVPMINLEQIWIQSSGVTVSSDVVSECMKHGIQINFLSRSGKPYAKLVSPNLVGTIVTRREQILAFYDQRGLNLARAFIEGKTSNQINLLKYFAKYRKGANKAIYDAIYQSVDRMEEIRTELKQVKGKCIDEVRPLMLSHEGRLANYYWNVVRLLVDGKIEFTGREHRGANDPFNSLLNYGYGMLKQQITGGLMLAGLDPFAGFMHVDRSGRESLVLDFMEEFRQPVVDRTVIALVNKGTEIHMEGDYLADQTRRYVAERIIERLNTEVTFEGKRFALRKVIQKQARRAALFLRGEAKYRPYIGGW